MTCELEKMTAGLVYDAKDKDLAARRDFAKDLCSEFNQILPSDTQKASEILKKLLGKCSDIPIILPNFFCDYGFNIEMGAGCFFNHNCVILDCAKVSFGNKVFAGPNCGFYTACHPLDAEERAAVKEFAKPIIIGNNVWLGGNVSVLGGVTIGDNSVIGAGSVVVKNIPPNTIAVGNPCKPLREITDIDKMGIL